MHTLASVLAVLVFASGGQVAAQGAGDRSPFRFEISVAEKVRREPTTGRVYVMISRRNAREPRLQIGRTGVPFFGEDIDQLLPGKNVIIDADSLGTPLASLRELPMGDYFVQAFLNVYTKFERSDGHTLWMHMDQWEGQHWNRSPGNAYSGVQRLHLDPARGGTYHFEIDSVIPPIDLPADTKMLEHIRIQSKLLSEFWGHPIFIGATVLLPRGYDQNPSKSYAVIYKQGHFSTRPPYQYGPESEWMEDDFPRLIAVTLQHPTPYFDDSYAINSVNNGPYGDAIHEELIPEIERRFRVISEPWARVLTGGSTGGWEAVALQVYYPDFYGGSWAFSPDPLDFRNVEGINVYEDQNAFFKIHEWRNVPTPNTRDPLSGEVVLTSEQRNRFELVNGTKGRSGQQIDIWSAVFGPVGEDGYFKPLFDKHSGGIDHMVAEYWRENFDIRYYLEQNWHRIGPKLVGKLHIFAGRRDNYYLNVGVEHLEDFLKTTRDPYYAGTFSYGGRGGHSWSPFESRGELIRVMAAHIEQSRPAGSNGLR